MVHRKIDDKGVSRNNTTKTNQVFIVRERMRKELEINSDG